MSENVQTFSGKVNVADNLLVGTSHFFVDRQNNRVGIGTSTPDASSMLDVTGNIKSGGTITATGGFSGNGSGLTGVNSDSGSWVNGSSSNIHLAVSTDKVGIGTATPMTKLDIECNTAQPSIVFSEPSNSRYQTGIGSIHISGQGQRLDFYTGDSGANGTLLTNSPRMSITGTGNVGIGATSPQTNLHIESSGSMGVDIYGGGTSHPYIFIGEHQSTYSSKWGGKLTYYGDSNVRWLNISVVDDNVETAAITVRRNGHIGINQQTPTSQLEVNGTIKAGTHMNGGNPHFAALNVSGGGSGSEQQPVAIVNSYAESDTIIFCDRNPWVSYAIAHENSSNDFLITGGGGTNAISNYNVRDFDGTQQTAYVKHRFDVDNAHLEIGGLLKAGLGNSGDLINFGTRSLQAAVYMVSANSTNSWDNYPAFYSPGEAEMRWHGNPNDLNIRSDGWVYGHGGFAPFTGVHTCNSYFGEDKIGLIVCSNGDYCTDDKRCKAWFNDIKIMNTSPLINLCTKEKDKSVFGVIGKIQNTYKKIEFIRKLDYECLPPDQKELYEPLVTGYKHRKTQDEITIEEYDALENKKYFKPIFEQAKAINYDGSTKFQVTHVNSLGEGGIWVTNKSGNFENGDYITSSSVPGYGQKQDDDLLHNYTVAKITTDCGFTKITYTRRHIEQIDGIHQYDENNEPIYINEIDEDGNVIQDLKFKLRYLLPNGTQISEEEYTTRALADERVFIAAFVGCTYHCG